jgi:hypothetical protein
MLHAHGGDDDRPTSAGTPTLRLRGLSFSQQPIEPTPRPRLPIATSSRYPMPRGNRKSELNRHSVTHSPIRLWCFGLA